VYFSAGTLSSPPFAFLCVSHICPDSSRLNSPLFSVPGRPFASSLGGGFP
jgi:hypothetical protein